MKNHLTLLLTVFTLLFTLSSKAQVYDGITQPTRFRVWVPVTTSIHNENATTVAPFIGYKQDVCDWFSVTPMENIVKKLLDEGLSVDEISKKIGMSREEIFRLSKIDRETFLKLVTSRGSQSFSKAQVVRQG